MGLNRAVSAIDDVLPRLHTHEVHSVALFLRPIAKRAG